MPPVLVPRKSEYAPNILQESAMSPNNNAYTNQGYLAGPPYSPYSSVPSPASAISSISNPHSPYGTNPGTNFVFLRFVYFFFF